MTITNSSRYVMRLRIAHTTSYRYEPPASGVIQILRMTPGSHDGQYVAEWQIDVSTDSRLDVHQDAFGNVTHVLTHGPIADLTINVEGLIETHDTGGVLRGTDERFPPSLFLRSTALTEVNPAMATFVRELRSESDGDVLGFLHALMVQINEHMTFDEDPTNSGTSAAEAFASSAASARTTRISSSPARAPAACRRASSPGISCAPTAPSTSRPGMPGRKPMYLASAGSGSIPPTASAPPTPMHASPLGSTISAPRRCAAPAMAAARRRYRLRSRSNRPGVPASRSFNRSNDDRLAAKHVGCTPCPVARELGLEI